MDRLKKSLRKLRIKIITENAVKYLFAALILSLSINIVLVFISKFIFISEIDKIRVFIFLITLFVMLAAFLFKIPTYYDIAIKADSLGFKERFITAYEILKEKNETEFSKYVISDALEKAENNKIHKLYKLKFPKKFFYIVLILILSNLFSGFIPNTNAEKIEEQKDIKIKINDELIKLNNIKEELNLKNSKNELINNEVKKLEKELKKSNTKQEAVKAIRNTQKELLDIQKKKTNKNLKKLEEMLSKNDITDDFLEAVNENDSSKMQKQKDELYNKLKNLNDTDKKNISEQLDNIASQMGESQELKKSIEELSQSILNNSNDSETIKNNIESLQKNIEEIEKENSDVENSIEKINKELSESANKFSKQENSQNIIDSDENKTDSNNGNNNSENNKNESQGNLNDEKNKLQNNKSSEQRGKGHIENKEIYSRKAQDYKEYGTKLNNQASNYSLQDEKNGTGTSGEVIEYDKIYNNYKEEALNSLESEDIPYGVKEIIKDYFLALE